MSYHCSRCDEEITYPLDYTDFETGLRCAHCQRRHDKYDDSRVKSELQRRRNAYIDRMIREFVDRKLDELLGE